VFPTSKALGPLTSAGVWAPSPCATAGLMLVFPEVKFVGSDSEVSMSHCGLLRTGSVLSLIFSGLCNQASCGIITSPLATPAHQWTTLVLSWTASIEQRAISKIFSANMHSARDFLVCGGPARQRP